MSLTYVLVHWIIPLVMVPVVARRHRRPTSALMWIAVIFAIPWVGPIAYLLFGVVGLRRQKSDHARVREKVDAARKRAGIGITGRPGFLDAEDGEGKDMRVAHVAHELYSRGLDGGNPALGGNAMELLRDEAVVEQLLHDIRHATSSINMLFFVFAADETGRRVARALEEASRRGVKCRVVVDAHGSRKMLKEVKPSLEEHGVAVSEALPISPWQQPLRRVDIRNHRKIALIDGTIAYTGSTNLHDPDYQLDHGEWHQVTARIRGPAVSSLHTIFSEDWYFATDELLDPIDPPDAAGDVRIQVIADGPTYPTHLVQHMLIEMLGRARRSVTMTTPYFVPDEPLLVAIRLAALRGVDVKVIVPEQSDRGIADAAARGYFEPLLETGVTLLLHGHGVLHAKSMVVDEEIAMLGTANLDRRSLFLNYELMLLIFDEGVAKQLYGIHETYAEKSRRVDPEQWSQRSQWEKIGSDTAKLFSPVL